MDNNNELRDEKGKVIIDYPYLVFSIEASKTREDYFKIPEIAIAHESLMSAVKAKKFNEAEKDAFPAFRVTCLTSSDLIFDDALNLVKREEAKLKATLSAQQVSTKAAPKPWTLKSLNLYGTATS